MQSMASTSAYPWQLAQGADLDRYHRAATIIQSYYRGYRVRRRADDVRKLAEEEALLRRRELVRQRTLASRLLKQQAKDVLLAIYAQSQYNRTRDRIMQARMVSKALRRGKA